MRTHSVVVYGYCVVLSLILCLGQILFKSAALRQTEAGFSLPMLLISPWFVAAISVYGLSTLLWVYILVRLPLSTAYPFALVGTALVPIAAHFAFDESLGKRAWVGFCVILCGLYIMNSK